MTDLSLHTWRMEKNPDNINLEWYHHLKCWKRFCDEGKIRRQQRKVAKGEGTSSKGPTSTEVSPVEVEPIQARRKIRVNQSQKLRACSYEPGYRDVSPTNNLAS